MGLSTRMCRYQSPSLLSKRYAYKSKSGYRLFSTCTTCSRSATAELTTARFFGAPGFVYEFCDICLRLCFSPHY